MFSKKDLLGLLRAIPIFLITAKARDKTRRLALKNKHQEQTSHQQS